MKDEKRGCLYAAPQFVSVISMQVEEDADAFLKRP